MGFPTNYLPGPTLLDHTEPRKSDSDSVTSTIPTDHQLKRPKIDPVRPIITNDGYHLVSSSKTQPKITPNTHAPPHLIWYPYTVIPQDPPGYYNQKTTPPAKNLSVKTAIRQLNQIVPPPKATDDVEAHSAPKDTLDSEPPTPPVFSSTLEWTEVTSARPTEKFVEKNTKYPDDNGCPYDDNYDDDFTPVPSDMFKMNPSILPPAQTTSVMAAYFNKLKPTKLIPTITSNKYAIFASDDKEDDINKNYEGIQQPSNVQQAPETGVTQKLIIQTMTTTKDGDDGNMNDTTVVPVTVHLHLQNKETIHKVLTTAMDLGSLTNSNKNMPEYDEFNDEASQVPLKGINMENISPTFYQIVETNLSIVPPVLLLHCHWNSVRLISIYLQSRRKEVCRLYNFPSILQN